MKNNTSSKFRIFLGLMVIFLMISACNLGSMVNREDDLIKATFTPMVNSDVELNSISDSPDLDEPKNEIELVTVYRLDGTEEVVPRTYTSFSELLDAKVEKGEWSQGEGLVQLLKIFSPDNAALDLPELEFVNEKSGSGLVRLSAEYIEENPQDLVNINELKRMLAQFLPSEEVLELISVASTQSSYHGFSKNAMIKKQSSAAGCANLERLGFDLTHFEGEPCYIFVIEQHNGMNYRVYYPSTWQGDQVKTDAVKVALSALIDSARVFSLLGGFYNINMTISLTDYPLGSDERALAIQHPISGRSTCPITLFKVAGSVGVDNLKQTIAHEVFHCFQDWNISYEGYDDNKWWIEGSAEYFSNVVYPTFNYEHTNLQSFDEKSITKPINQMDYENFLFFQHLGNVYGDSEVIRLLKSSGVADGSITPLASFDNMDSTFQDFVVAYMSTGIQDTGGGMIAVSNPAVIKTETIDRELEEKFSIHPFVSGRYRMNYKEEKRFLQSPDENGDGKYSTAEFDLRKDLSSWSSLPPEIRTKCDEDLLYALVVTTTETSGQFTFIANIEKVEKAECDPCLLGVWEVDNSSFEEYIKGLLDSQGGLEGFPPGMELLLEVDGYYYVEFKENSEMLTRRDNFSILSGAEGFPGLKTIIDSQGSGGYSTSDGKQLSLYNMVDYVNQVQAYIEDMPINVNLTPNASTYSMFGASASGPGFENSSDQDNISSDYICEKDELMIDHPEFGKLLYNRVEKILPTPVPTASP